MVVVVLVLLLNKVAMDQIHSLVLSFQQAVAAAVHIAALEMEEMAVLVAVLATGLAAGACSGTDDDVGGADTVGGLAVSAGWVRAAPAAGNSAAYMIIRNDGPAPDRLLAALTPAAATVEIHRTEMEGGVARMVHQAEGLELPAGSTVALEPGGLHVMLMDLVADLEDGQTILLTLQFEQSGGLTLELPVRRSDAAHMDMGAG